MQKPLTFSSPVENLVRFVEDTEPVIDLLEYSR